MDQVSRRVWDWVEEDDIDVSKSFNWLYFLLLRVVMLKVLTEKSTGRDEMHSSFTQLLRTCAGFTICEGSHESSPRNDNDTVNM